MTRFRTSLTYAAAPFAALMLSACATTASAPDTTTAEPTVPSTDEPAGPSRGPASEPDVAESTLEDVEYVTEVDRIPQLDGSTLVVTTIRGSDGSVFVSEEIVSAATPSPGSPSRGIGGGAADEEARDFADIDDFGDVALGEENAIMVPVGETCDAASLAFDFDWPPPEPSARVVIPRFLVQGQVPTDALTVSRVQTRVEGALRRAGYIEPSYYTIGCDGFAIVTRMEQIDRSGQPVDGGMRFTPPRDDEPFNLASYITRLFYAPPGFYRQIILAATDEPYDPENLAPAPDEDDMERTFERGSRTALDIDDAEMWGDSHVLHALIYEFRTEGARTAKQSLPSDVTGADHVRRAGIYRNLD